MPSSAFIPSAGKNLSNVTSFQRHDELYNELLLMNCFLAG